MARPCAHLDHSAETALFRNEFAYSQPRSKLGGSCTTGICNRKDFKMATTRNETASDQISRAADAVRDSVRGTTESTDQLADQVTQLFGFGGDRGQEVTRQATQNIEAVTHTSTVLVRGFRDVSHECLDVLREQLQRNVDGITALLRCRSVPDVMAAQSEFWRTSLESTVEGTRRLAEVSTRVADEASRTLATHADRGGRRRAA